MANHKQKKIEDGWKCTRCNAWIKPSYCVWLDFSQTDGKYYYDLPAGHVSQGGFPFGKDCAKLQVMEDQTEVIHYAGIETNP
jgi:hypothetical protein